MPVSKLPSVAVAECPVGPELLQVTVSPTLTVVVLGANLKSLIVTPAEAAAIAMTFCLGLSTGASSRRVCWAPAGAAAGAGAGWAGAAAGAAGAGAAAAGAGAGAAGAAAASPGAGAGAAGAAAGSAGGCGSSETAIGPARASTAASVYSAIGGLRRLMRATGYLYAAGPQKVLPR